MRKHEGEHMGVKLACPRKDRTKAQEDRGAVETLVRQLVDRANVSASSTDAPARTGREDDSTPEVLLDREVDGVRCVLARARGPAESLSLSPREHEVARMIAKGYPNKVIASVLEISVWTVSTHLRRIFAKLGVTSRTAMVTRMFKNGKL
jgi:two-component system nitrate/nitrite response regulator NarL